MTHYRSRPVEDLTVTEFLYQLYFDDPKISALIDEYVEGIPLALHVVLKKDADADPDEAASRLRAELFERIAAAISEWIWAEFPALRHSRRADRATVDDLARARARELIGRLSSHP